MRILLLVFLWIGLCTLDSSSAASPNFLFFVPDELRASSAYGEVDMPNLESLAADGVKFMQAHTTSTVCSQSRASFMTGWPVHTNGHRSLWSLLREYEPNLLRYMHDEGYEVRWYGKNDNMNNESIFESTAFMDTGGGAMYGDNPFPLGDPRYYSFLYEPLSTTDENATKDAKNVQAAIEYLQEFAAARRRRAMGLDEAEEKPFFLFLPLTYPHPPYSCPEPWYSMVDPDDVVINRPVSTEMNGKPDYHAGIRASTGQDRLNATEAEDLYRKIRAVYLGCSAYSDHLLGRVMETLKQEGLVEDTAFFYFADHGDYAGDWGLVEKWPSGLEDALTRVPLVIRAPFLNNEDNLPSKVEELVQLYDIVPTVLDIAGISQKHVHFAQTLLPYLSSDAESVPPRTEVYSEGGYSTHEPRDSEGYVDGMPDVSSDYYYKSLLQQTEPLTVCRAVMVRNATAKLVYRTDPLDQDHNSELYDLVLDPYELQNLYDDPHYASLQAALTTKILAWMVQTSDITPWSVCDRITGECDPEPF